MLEKKNTAILSEKNEIEDKSFNLENRLKQTQNRFSVVNSQLDDTITENQKLQGKINSRNNSFVDGTGGDGNRNETLELLKANYERDEHKWNAEKLELNARVLELEQIIKTKDEDASRTS